MSFSSKTKNELSRIEVEDKCCQIAELSALIRMSGSIQISGLGKISIKFTTENAAIARRIFSLLKKIYDIHTEVRVRKNRQLKKNNNYLMIINNPIVTNKVLADTGIYEKDKEQYFNINYGIPERLIDKRCCRRSYIRGAFLGGGSLSDPEKTYHLEFVTHSSKHAKDLSNLINSFDLNSKIVTRKENYVVYLKEGEQIVDLLNIIGAHSALLKLENIRVLKEVRNNINRIVNCETANLSKTINAALRQIKNIQYIDEVMGIENLSKGLADIARLRLQNREASLKELGQMLSPPVGKSGVNHRLRKIEEIADKLRMERGEYDAIKEDSNKK
ncbi:DNA-binding protein WhiA [Thermohalobacter berrensis]|uniref:Probable cell division protein WhiA n=1 Tax=Thermohalobacter berrensis TaxID=99594 RepID=A0A419T7L6_9FIRM|nr:DNA-binding protein WhiA [Thermohalobacter berrensis]RKD33403.1 DNA-binding protein WhiA [Thermohalobacter berrensis]